MGEPSLEQLALYFHLDDRNRALLELRHHAYSRLGFAPSFATLGSWEHSFPIQPMFLT
ncbi:DUF4158 domain-containing protein [Ktedonosporobacter rubrisoli]|uniref:DUF4158 domain-containing protein n=1 Tax=Ktedonosporobacter rubrisoli TaxID=2509675 RepID=UPI0013EEB840|nr:DUF4158 domain-containing protein [Ktedonosporobacter rubrisoli]